MMKHHLLTPADDLTLTPPPELNEKTYSKMLEVEQASQTTTNRMPKRYTHRVLICAALVCAALMLMSAGYRVFSYLVYVPGMGIVTEEWENTYTLVEAVQEGGYFVEAMSLVPNEEGTWNVHVITDRPGYCNHGENSVPPLTLTDPDGNTTTIPFSSGGSDDLTRYTGTIDKGTAGVYTLQIEGTTYTVELASVIHSSYADYRYPTDNGITLICFPMSDGSDKLVFDMILEPESESMAFWQSHSDTISASIVGYVTITDVEGNIYKTHSQSIYTVNANTDDLDVLSYKLENVLTMDKHLSASIATIAIDQVELQFGSATEDTLTDMPQTALTVPALEETVETDTLLWDIGGVRLTANTLSASYAEGEDTYAFAMTSTVGSHDFTENITHIHLEPSYASPKDPATRYRGGSSSYTGDIHMVHHKDIVGAGDKKIRTGSIDVDFGDEILVSPGTLYLTIAGEWNIDFTGK